jgi:hypothetical protein
LYLKNINLLHYPNQITNDILIPWKKLYPWN